MQKDLASWKQKKVKATKYSNIFSIEEQISENSLTEEEASFFVINAPDWVNIIPINKKKEVVLIKQFRHGTQEFTLEIPGGIIDGNETPKTAAERELIEETGFTPGKITYLGKSRPNPAIQSNWIYHFLAVHCEKTGKTKFDRHESIVTKLIPVDKISKLIENEKINHSLVLAAFYKLWVKENK